MISVVEIDAGPEVSGGIGFEDDEFGGISTDCADGLFNGGETVSGWRLCNRFRGSHGGDFVRVFEVLV